MLSDWAASSGAAFGKPSSQPLKIHPYEDRQRTSLGQLHESLPGTHSFSAAHSDLHNGTIPQPSLVQEEGRACNNFTDFGGMT
jgi:hypothetical protein